MVVCPDCAHPNDDAAKFCSECGAKLTEPSTPSRQVRKTVTIVFCDVTGSTALGERLDPETLRGVMTRYFDRMGWRAALRLDEAESLSPQARDQAIALVREGLELARAKGARVTERRAEQLLARLEGSA